MEDVKNKVTLVDSGTSPAKCEFTHAAASPIMFEPLSPTRKPKIDVDDYSLNHKTMVDRAVSPIKCTDFSKFAKFGNDQSPVFHFDKIAKNDPHEDNNDREIELIFRNMRFEQSLITPMPMSPSRLSDIENRSLSTVFESCEGADLTKLKDENKRLQSNVVLIKKEMMKLKRFVHSMGLKEEFNKFMHIAIINEVTAMDAVALEIVQMENPVSPVNSIDNDDNITLDLDDYEDHVNDMIPPVNNDDLLFAEPDETLTEEHESSNVECTENDQVLSCKNYETSKKITKARKLSKLDKLRKRMLPKSKIRRLAGPAKRFLRSMTKRLSPYSRSSPVLSKQQDAYSKAVLIWKQLNSKKKVSHEKDTAKPSINKETKTPNTDKNKIQSKNELCSNKFDNKVNNNSQLQKQTNKSWQSSEAGGGKEYYGNKIRKSSISLPDGPHADSNNINSLDSDKALFVVLESSLNEKVQRLQKEHVHILNTDNDTVQLPKGAKSPKVNPIAGTETSSKRMLRSSSTTERKEDIANKSKTDNMVLYSDVKSLPKSEPENTTIQTRRSIRRASQEARENRYEEVISNNKDTSYENVKSPDRRERRKHLNKTQIQCRRLLRSSNQLLDSSNSPESQKIGSSVSRTDTKQPGVPLQQQGCQSTSANNTLTCRGRTSRRSSIQQSDKNTLQGECDKIDNETSPLKRKGIKRKNENSPAIRSKRTLRSSTVLLPSTRNNNDNMEAKPYSATYNEMLHGGERKAGIGDPEKETNRNLRNNAQHNIAGNKNNNNNTETNAPTNEKDSSIFLTFLKNQSNKNSNHVTCQEAGEERQQNVENETCVSHTDTVDKRQNSILIKAISKHGRYHEKKSKKKLPGINLFKYLLLCI